MGLITIILEIYSAAFTAALFFGRWIILLLTNSYNLVYTGLDRPQHILQAVKTDIISKAISATDSVRLAEYFLKVLKFDEFISSKSQEISRSIGDIKENISAERLADYTKHIHRAKSQEIRERFLQPELSDEQTQEIIADSLIQPLLDKLNKNNKIELEI